MASACGKSSPSFSSIDAAAKWYSSLEKEIALVTYGVRLLKNTIHPAIVDKPCNPYCDQNLWFSALPEKPDPSSETRTVIWGMNCTSWQDFAYPSWAYLQNVNVCTFLHEVIGHAFGGVDHSHIHDKCKLYYSLEDGLTGKWSYVTAGDVYRLTGQFPYEESIPKVPGVWKGGDFMCIMCATNIGGNRFNAAIASLMGIATPVGTLSLGQSGTFTLPDARSYSQNHVRVKFSGTVSYYISYQKFEGPMTSGTFFTEATKNPNFGYITMQTVILIHKVDLSVDRASTLMQTIQLQSIISQEKEPNKALPNWTETISDVGGKFTIVVPMTFYWTFNDSVTVSVSVQ